MTPPTCATFRRAAALLHAIPGLRATVWSDAAHIVTVTPSKAGNDPEAGVRLCHPCLFRRTIASARAHLDIGDRVGVFGLPVGINPTVEFFTEGRCRLGPTGIISWDLDDGATVLCFATLLDVDVAMEVAGQHLRVGPAAMSPRADAGRDDHPHHRHDQHHRRHDDQHDDRHAAEAIALQVTGTRVDFFRDVDLDISLVYSIVEGGGSGEQPAFERATTSLLDLMVLYGAEEIARDPDLLMAVGS